MNPEKNTAAVNSTIAKIVSLLRRGLPRERIRSTILKQDASQQGASKEHATHRHDETSNKYYELTEELFTEFEELLEIARARIKAGEKFSNPEKWFFNSEQLRFATPEIVAEYRAERLKCTTIADLCCGIGSQSIAFARKCKRVYAVDNDDKKIIYAERNADSFGIKNISFLCADIFDADTRRKIKGAEIIFCDPERGVEERERNIGQIPLISHVVENYSQITSELCIECPPQISPDRIGLDCEREYISLHGRLNRLNLYFGGLKQCERSAVALPSKERICSSEAIHDMKIQIQKPVSQVPASESLKYVYEADQAVAKAGLIPELVEKLSAEHKLSAESSAGLMLCSDNTIRRITMLTSNQLIESPFLRTYSVIGKSSRDEQEMTKALKSVNAGRILLRASIEPSRYWHFRKGIEDNLSGKESIVLFLFDEKALICKRL